MKLNVFHLLAHTYQTLTKQNENHKKKTKNIKKNPFQLNPKEYHSIVCDLNSRLETKLSSKFNLG